MSGKSKQRSVANAATAVTQTITEKILKECHTLYTDADNGLVKIAESLGLPLLAPKKKISILLIGNHSSGKSSFINWYVEEHVQKTGVAIETQGFAFVTSGRKRESLTGNATLHLYPHFEPLRKIQGVTDYVTTEVSTSKQKKFSLVTFIDSPGLVDGDMKYPFDVNQAILWLGDLADLIFVFFDPIGQALCKRTLNLVEKLNEKYADRMRFYLTKADEAGFESDRQRVMMQIVQELCKRPGLNRTGFDMPTIYIPSLSSKGNRCVNQIEEVCMDIEKTINQAIQNTLNTLEKDCDQIADMVENKLQQDCQRRSLNFEVFLQRILFFILAFTCPAILFMMSDSSDPILDLIGSPLSDSLHLCVAPLRNFWNLFSHDFQFFIASFLLLLPCSLLLIMKFNCRPQVCLSRKEKRSILEMREHVQNTVKRKKQNLYHEYLKQSIADQDM